ncbi:MAG: pantoate--beta-alanine ligase [Planctomycetota bacterium]|jgi:pantoate--beta-alanine ligase
MRPSECLAGAKALQKWRDRLPPGLSLGLVPTMGALHEGHLSLVREAKRENDRVIVSIYVNPIQFGPGEDFKAYPREIEKDLERVGEAGGDVVVTFEDEEMYPPGYATFVSVEGLTEGLCGASRPGHFRGVTTVVTKLFHFVRPHRAYFGQKDAQQAAVIRRMTEDLAFGIEIRVLPTVREADGLAMSSRNEYLSPEERERALCLFQALERAKALVKAGEREVKILREAMTEIVRTVGGEGARIEYIEVVDPETFAPLTRIGGQALAVMAVQVGPTRLIDNMVLL